MKLPVQASLSALLIGLTALTAGAIPAKRGVLHVQQPDGTTLAVELVGDEHAHQYFTPDGYLLKPADGYYYYATPGDDGALVSSGIRAYDQPTQEAIQYMNTVDRQAVRRTLQAQLENSAAAASRRRVSGLFPESRFPAMGEQRAIVILVEYKDVKMSTDNAYDYFNRMLNEYGFSDYGGTGCAKEFFELNSGGNFICDFDVFGPITLAQNMSYYGGNDWSGNDQNPEMMVVEACQALDGQVDFSEYDRDGDGYVDNVFIFYAGRGEASGGSANTVWPHSWTLTSAGVSTSRRTFDGVIVDRYGCSNEWEGTRPDGVGTFIHEFSHVIGLPDLYATSYTSSFTPGAWSALDYGPYNNDGCTPPNYGAFERAALGWMEPVRIQGPMNATLPPITENVAGIIYDDANPDEYFLFENRQQTGWDTYIPGHGMLIWHVDYQSSVWASNIVNNTPSHQYVDIEEADNSRSDYSRDGDSFPGASNVTSFTDTTTPNMKRWNGRGLELPITEIAETNGIISFLVAGGASEMVSPEVTASPASSEELLLEWEHPDGAGRLYANVYEMPEVLPTNDASDYSELIKDCTLAKANVDCGDSGSFTIDGLTPQTGYIIETTLRNGLQNSPARYAEAFTGRPTLDRLTVRAIETANVEETGFTAIWERLEEADNYLLSVYEKVFGAPNYDECNFDNYDSTLALPEGWSSNSAASYANTSYSGKAVPALRLGRTGDRVQTPAYDDDIRSIAFWHRGNGTVEGDILYLSFYDTEAEMWSIYKEVAVETAAGGAVTEIDDIPAGYKQARIEFRRTTTKGAVAIDDVVVGHGETFTDVVVPEYDAVAVGNVESFDVTGLKPETTYRWTVAATDGTLTSRASTPLEAVTKASSGISGIATSALRVAAGSGSVRVTGAEADGAISLCDLSGRIVAAATANAAGNATLTVNTPGFYIVRTGRAAVKVAVR